MRKVRCIRDVYFFITLRKDYDVVEYNSKEDTIKIYNDMGMLANLKINTTLLDGRDMVKAFQDVTAEYRNDTINYILS